MTETTKWNMRRAYAFADVYPFTVPVLEYLLSLHENWATLASIRDATGIQVSTQVWSNFANTFGSPKSGSGIGFIKRAFLNQQVSEGLRKFRINPQKRKNVEKFISDCNSVKSS